MKNAALGFVFLIWASPILLAEANEDLSKRADTFYQSQQWVQAAAAYEQLTKQNANDGRAWFRLGMCMNRLGKPEKAIEHFATAKASGVPAANVNYGLSISYAQLGRPDRALDHLQDAAKSGFSAPQLISGEAEFESLKNEQRFADALEAIQRNAAPCKHDKEFRKFDFWLGVWDVYQNGSLAGTNRIELILDDCVIYENWTGINGYTGKSFNIYNQNTRKWEQVWVDNTGGILKLEGQFKNGTLHYTGTTTSSNGSKVMERLTFTPLAGNEIRQLWEQSSDGGKEWKTVFDGLYKKKSS